MTKTKTWWVTCRETNNYKIPVEVWGLETVRF